MIQHITVKQNVEALDDQIIPLLEEGMFLEGQIRIDDVAVYLHIYNNGPSDPSNEYTLMLCGESEFFVDEMELDGNCSASDIIDYITEFRSNPYQFAETYGN